MFADRPRTSPTRPMPAPSAIRTAKPVGCEMAARTEIPKHPAFCTSPKLARLVDDNESVSRRDPGACQAPKDLVERVVGGQQRRPLTCSSSDSWIGSARASEECGLLDQVGDAACRCWSSQATRAALTGRRDNASSTPERPVARATKYYA